MHPLAFSVLLSLPAESPHAGLLWHPPLCWQPGHGDLYPAMLGTQSLDALLAKGFKYMFVSNSDNLGATMDLKLLTWFAESGKPFAMECAQRTDADKKGGHLAQDAKGQMLLRESAQCPNEDEKEFQNVGKYKYFNTNSERRLRAPLAAFARPWPPSRALSRLRAP